jgi:hypothetical protein
MGSLADRISQLSETREMVGMSQDRTYEGWSNYPTWAVNLWLANDQGLYYETMDKAQYAVDNAPDDPNVPTIWTVEESALYELATTLKNWVTDDLSPDLGATFAADLLGYALGEVDWHEIAKAWLRDLEEVTDES